MMTSNLLSKFLPANNGQSIYEELRAHDEPSQLDIEDQAGLALDEENLRYTDDHFDNAEVFSGEDSRITTASTTFLSRDRAQSQGRQDGRHGNDGPASVFLSQSPRLLEDDEEDDVPESLLVEGNDMVGPSTTRKPTTRRTSKHKRPSAMPGPSNRENRAHWETAQAQHQLHQENRAPSNDETPRRTNARLFMGTAKDKAMWRWNNVVDIDGFMHEVYDYYKGRGMACILLERSLSFA
jgi:autophagy-related protein 9